jgi:hypothetical protein
LQAGFLRNLSKMVAVVGEASGVSQADWEDVCPFYSETDKATACQMAGGAGQHLPQIAEVDERVANRFSATSGHFQRSPESCGSRESFGLK